MPRPSKFSREKALELAMNEIWRTGYVASSVKALSEKLGITRSSFYNAFKSREALFDEVLRLYLSQAPDRALMEATPDMSVKALFTDIFRAVCAWRSADPEARGCLAVNCVAELGSRNDELGEKLKRAVGERVARIETILGWGIAKGEIDREVDAHGLALTLQSLFIGLNVLSKVVRDEHDLWQVARTALRGLNLLAET